MLFERGQRAKRRSGVKRSPEALEFEIDKVTDSPSRSVELFAEGRARKGTRIRFGIPFSL